MAHVLQATITQTAWNHAPLATSKDDRWKAAEKNWYYIAWTSNGGEEMAAASDLLQQLLAAGSDQIKATEAARRIEAIAARLRTWEEELAADYQVNMEKSNCYEI